MTQSFDEFKKEFGVNDSPYSAEHYIIESSFKAGAASRQTEIDGLSTLNEMSEQKIDDLVLRNIELQKRLAMYERKGYKLVPVEPTKEILDALESAHYADYEGGYYDEEEGYKAMIGAVE